MPTTARKSQRKPAESAFKQQRLPAWQPILTASSVLPTFFILGIAFVPIGIAVLYAALTSNEVIVDYTHCQATEFMGDCADYIKSYRNLTCKCKKTFTLVHDMKPPVYMYYALTNYYQNHRRYVKSRDDTQLLGKLSKVPSSDCNPYAYAKDRNGVEKPIAPCGSIANSLFNDKINLHYLTHYSDVPLIRTGIAWPSDKEIKFRNPPGDLKEALKDYAKPIDWIYNVWELDPNDTTNNGFQNEDFIIWMRTAALPNFRKLYRRVNHSQYPFDKGLPKGEYVLEFTYSYPVTVFKGTKSVIVTTASPFGSKNPFLGVIYIIVGCLCLTIAVVFLVLHIKYRKSTMDVINITPTTSYQ